MNTVEEFLPESWGTVPLGDLVEIHDGARRPVKSSERVAGPIPYCGANGVIDHVDGHTHDGEFVMLAEDGGFYGPGERSAYMMSGKFWANNHVHIVRGIEGKLLSAYLRYYLVHADLHPFLTGATRPKLTQGAMLGIPVVIPFPNAPARSLETQRRIVARIEALLAEVAEARRLNSEIAADTDHLLVAALRTSFEELSSSAPPARLGDRTIAEVFPGQHVMSADYSSAPPGTPYITGPADFGAKFPVISRWTAKPTVMSKPGDVLFTVKGSGVGKVNVAPPDGPICIGRQVMAIRPNQDCLLTDFLFFALLGRFDEFQALRQGAAIPGIRKEHVESIEIPLPPRNQQLQVISYLEAVQNEVSEMLRTQVEEAKMLEEIEQALLRQAFRGEL